MDDGSESLIRRVRDAQALSALVGQAPPFRKAIGQLPEVARSDAAVLISGETGTGKELVARAIHYLSDRAPFPFVAVNCGALAESLLEDELFGHEPGAFTDAKRRRPGLVAEAGRGTLFLDEIESLTDRGQAKLLRVVQERTFRALGSSTEQHAPARFVAATNVAMSRCVQAGTFRRDLYYRLCVFSIALPPLRERKDDIPMLAAHFLGKHARPDRPACVLSPAAQAALMAFDWPGNVREMENAMIRAIQLCRTGSIEVEDLDLPEAEAAAGGRSSDTAPSFKTLKQRAVEAFEREYLTRILSEHHGNVTRAARSAAKDRRDLGRLLKKHDIDPRVFAPGAGGNGPRP